MKTKKSILLFDAVNSFSTELVSLNGGGLGKLKVPAKKVIDMALELLIMAYVFGVEDADEMLGLEFSFEDLDVDRLNAAVYFRYEDGKTFEDRMKEYAPEDVADESKGKTSDSSRKEPQPHERREENPESVEADKSRKTDKGKSEETEETTKEDKEQDLSGTVFDVLKVAETEAHRIFNAGIIDTAEESGIDYTKTWVTMMDEKVRDTHWYLEGSTVSRDERFYTFDDDSALYPGGFSKAQNNVNCRCNLVINPI